MLQQMDENVRSNSCMPAKYHGAFVGLRLKSGFALLSRGALRNTENTRTTAINTKATINSR